MATHAYWRVYTFANNGATDHIIIMELEFRATVGGADQANGGTPFASTSYTDASWPGPTGAFNNNGSALPGWAGGYQQMVAWIAYQFPAPVDVAEIAITSRPSFPTQAPKDFNVDYSDDGVTWTPYFGLRSVTSWTGGDTKLFTPADAGAVTVFGPEWYGGGRPPALINGVAFSPKVGLDYAAQRRNSFALGFDLYSQGTYNYRFGRAEKTVSGVVKDAAGNPLVRRVVLLQQATSVVVDTAMSAANGTFSLHAPDVTKCIAIAVPNTGDGRDAVVLSDITPA